MANVLASFPQVPLFLGELSSSSTTLEDEELEVKSISIVLFSNTKIAELSKQWTTNFTCQMKHVFQKTLLF